MTGLKPTTVDDRIKVLRGEGMISPLKQCYWPMHQHVAAQAVSCTDAQRDLQNREGR